MCRRLADMASMIEVNATMAAGSLKDSETVDQVEWTEWLHTLHTWHS